MASELSSASASPHSWSASGFDAALDAVAATLAVSRFPALPEGAVHAVEPRPMRAVFRITLQHDDGSTVDVAIKWHRDARRLRAQREGSVLLKASKLGFPVPRVLGWREQPVQMLATEWLTDLAPLSLLDGATQDEINMIAKAAAKTLRGTSEGYRIAHRDLHRANVSMHNGRPVLIDLGGARLERATGPLDGARLGQLHHGFMHGVRRTQQLRFLRAFLTAGSGGVSARRVHASARAAYEHSERHARIYRRGRDRRATRAGRHFDTFRDESSGIHGIAWSDEREFDVNAMSTACFAALFKQAECPPLDLRAVKRGRDGHTVFRLRHKGRDFAVKKFKAVMSGRTPRPLRAFRLAHAFENRYLPSPRAIAGVCGSDGRGIVVSEWIDALDLHAFFHDASTRGFAALGKQDRERLIRLLGRTLRHMHDCAVTHRDLKAPNLLVRAHSDEPFGMWFADLDGARIRRRPPVWRRRAKDLARLDASLPAMRADRTVALDAYMSVLPHPPIPASTMRQWIRPHVERKRGPSGLPR